MDHTPSAQTLAQGGTGLETPMEDSRVPQVVRCVSFRISQHCATKIVCACCKEASDRHHVDKSSPVDWMLSSRIKSVGLKVIFGDIPVPGGVGRFLTFCRSLGGSAGEQVVFMETRKKMFDNVRQRIF